MAKKTKRVVLFNSPIVKKREDVFEMEGIYPRIGIGSIAAALSEAGADVTVIDPMLQSETEILRRVSGISPDFVGISAFSEEIFYAAATAEMVKGIDADITTVVGGPHASALPVETLREFGSIDVAVVGEGEETMRELVSDVPPQRVRGIAFRQGERIVLNERRPLIEPLDSLPYPAWQLYDLEKYRGTSLSSGFGKKGMSLDLPVEGARGCPFDCIFCYRMNGRNIRFKSPKRIVDEVEHNVDEFGATSIFFIEGSFAVNRRIAIDMCDELIRRGLHKKITWSTGGRVNLLDKELLAKMKESGCSFIGIGVESGNQQMLTRIGKGITLERIREVFGICADLGIKTEANFILGHPHETERTVLETIDFAKSLRADYANFAILVPMPGTEIVEMAKRGEGGLRILTQDWKMYGKQIGAALELEQLPKKKLSRLQSRAYLEFYLTPGRLPVFLKRLSLKRAVHALKRLV
jgi:radical SAM superfamily enzyme YgiQ (UPF0313 family)